MTKGYLMNNLIEKMQSPDQDFRFMGLNDLMSEIRQDPASFTGDEIMENKVLRQVLALVEDKISEVKNQAVKCLGVLIKIIREPQLEYTIERLIDYSGGNDDELRDISVLALKTITSELPPDGKVAASACAKLFPGLLAQISNHASAPETLVEALSILSILINRFPTHMANITATQPPLMTLAPLLSYPRPLVRKRAIATLAQLVPMSPPELFSELLASNVFPSLSQKDANVDKQRTTVHLVAAIARHSPLQIGLVLPDIVPRVLEIAQKDDDELREGSLQASEALVLRCPGVIAPFLEGIIQTGVQFIKYDPNYAGDDEDEEMADAEDDDDDNEAEDYSDDEDTSYKIRRSATKLLTAVIGTRPELLTYIYKEVSLVLISRFGDREETVRLEVWATYAVLLVQTSHYGGLSLSQAGNITNRGKKRDSDGMDVEDTSDAPFVLLRRQVPAFAKALLKQLGPKTAPSTLQAGFHLLRTLLDVLPGSLLGQVDLLKDRSVPILSQVPTTTNSALHLTCLSFWSLFFATHPPTTFVASLQSLAPLFLKFLEEKHPRLASESFKVFSALLNAVKPVKAADWADKLYDEAVKRLSIHDTDAAVRGAAEDVIADLWICATDVMKGKGGKEWDMICRVGGKTDGAVRVLTKVGREVQVGENWVNRCIEWLVLLLKKGGRSGKTEIFGAIDVLLKSYRAGVPKDLPTILIPRIRPYISTSDISLLSHSLSIVALLLELSPSSAFPEVERDLADIYRIAHSVLISGAALDSILRFFSALVQADAEITTHVVLNLVVAVDKAQKSDVSPSNVAKCIAQIVKGAPAVAAGTIAEFSKHLKHTPKTKPSQLVLSLLVLGELGRFIDMSLQKDIFDSTIELFDSEQEDIRAAAAFAAGNIAIGNLHQFLSIIVKNVENDPKRRLLSLHALKEVVTHCSHGQLEGVAEMLWKPLFDNSEISEETTRNVAAACLGKLATTHPSRYLPQLHARVHDPNPATRATVIAAIRYTFADTSQTYDDLLAPLLFDFLSLITDEDLTVRRIGLSTLNSAARTKPHLIRDMLPQILVPLYQETEINPDLIRVVQMGPWKHTVDDGLETRKTAYETMYTLAYNQLDTCLAKIDLHTFLGRVLVGLADDSDEVKVISHMMLFRLSQVAPAAVSQRLDEVTPHLEKTMKEVVVTKDTVKQDLERAAELQRSTLRAVAALSKVSVAGSAPRFDAFVEGLKRSPKWGAEFKELVGA